jgi:predicted Zn-ribbon and HTH transcriptional regulator
MKTKARRKKFKCEFCGFIWTPRVENPRACAACKRYFYKKSPPEIKEKLEQIQEQARKETLEEVEKIVRKNKNRIKCLIEIEALKKEVKE